MAVTLNVDAVESLAKSWSRLDWDNLQIRIEEEVKAIGIRQDEGDEGKRLLLQESTSFRENTDKVLRKAAVPLIKAFQGEVDRLTVRSKAAESFVIDLCRSLTSLPDPSEYLNQLKSLILKSQRLKSCEEELCFLKSQIADLRDEYADLQNQELTVRTLREQVKKLETEAERNVQASLRDSEKRLRAEFDVIKKEMEEKQETLIDENKKLSATVTDLEISNREAKETVEGMRLKLDQKEAMEDEHLEIVSNDLEKAVHRAMEAEQEILRLREELSRISGNSSPYENSVGESALIRSKDNQIRKLLEENKALAGKLSKETEEARKRIDELTEELQRHSETVKRLEAQLQAQSDYDEIKKELRILRNVEFGEEITPSGDFADNGVVSAATATAEIHSGGHLKALDELLVEKNHKLQNENATLRMRNHETEERLAEVEGVKNENAAEVIRLQQLVTQLENDLLSMNSLQSLPNSSKGRLDDGIVDEKVSAASLLASELSETEKSSKVEATGNILAIVTAQRNRLKLRVKELEKETIDEKEHSAFLQSELDKAHHDNVQLYGKIKFLQNYQSRQQNKNDIRMEMNDAETRYRNEYEMHIDPFKKFNALERQRKYGQLKPYDKAALQLGRWMMSSGHSRAIFLIYLLFLHLLVFLVLYRFAYTESCQRDFRTDCIAKFRSHMHRYHPGSPDEVS